jgi:hypothetical protein
MASGHAAAETILKVPASAAQAYSSVIWDLFGRHEAPAATIQTTVLRHRRIASAAGRVVTRWPLSALLAESSAIYMGQLADGAVRGRRLGRATMIEALTDMMTSRSTMRRDIEASFRGSFADEPIGEEQHHANLLAA